MSVSPLRLRLGIILLFLWWIPFWLATPIFSVILGIDTAKSESYLVLAILIVQTILGCVGLALTGKEIANIVRHTSYKQMPGKVWHILVRGKFDAGGSTVVKKS